MRINQLEFFVYANKTGSFSKAAQELYVTQPAVSIGIRELEEYLGFQVFIRDKQGLKLTNEGKVILPWAEDVLNGIGKINKFANRAPHRAKGVRIAATRYIYNTVLFSVQDQAKRLEPPVSVEVLMSDGAELLELLMKNELDSGIIQMFDIDPAVMERAKSSRVVFEPMWRDAFIFICGDDHPLAKKERVSMKDIAQYDIVSFLPTPETPIMHALEVSGFNRRIINIGDMVSIRRYLISSEAVGFTAYASYHTIVGDYGGGISVLDPYDIHFDYDVCMAYKNHALSTAQKNVHELIKQNCRVLKPMPRLNEARRCPEE